MGAKFHFQKWTIRIGVRVSGLVLLFCCLGFRQPVSMNLNNQKIIKIEVKTDSTEFTLFQALDNSGQTQYFYRDIDQFPCDDSVCQRMQIRVYWDVTGYYLKFSMENGSQLTKLNHKPFSNMDYRVLDGLLKNRNSNLKYYRLDNLTGKQAEKHYYSVDAISGATITEVSYETVRGAVKTCFVLWKIANGETSVYIRKMNPSSNNIVK